MRTSLAPAIRTKILSPVEVIRACRSRSRIRSIQRVLRRNVDRSFLQTTFRHATQRSFDACGKQAQSQLRKQIYQIFRLDRNRQSRDGSNEQSLDAYDLWRAKIWLEPFFILWYHEMIPIVRSLALNRETEMHAVGARLAAARMPSPESVTKALAKIDDLTRHFVRFFSSFDVLLCP